MLLKCRVRSDEDYLSRVADFVLGKIPVGVIVFNSDLDILFSNRQANLFSKRHDLPDEITGLCRRAFEAVRLSKVEEQFPGEICLQKRFEGCPGSWSFMVHVCDGDRPFVSVFIVEDAFSNRIDLNRIRNRFRLTRRETDVLRRVLNGLKNADIAEELEISEQTVKDHLSNIYMKLGVENRFTLVSFLSTLPESPAAD